MFKVKFSQVSFHTMLLGSTTEHCQKTVFRFIRYEHRFICIYTGIYATDTKAHKKYTNQFKEPFFKYTSEDLCECKHWGNLCSRSHCRHWHFELLNKTMQDSIFHWEGNGCLNICGILITASQPSTKDAINCLTDLCMRHIIYDTTLLSSTI